ncbi:retropepsin-like aspartic protease [Aspergillus mulundensis]|uniref:Oxidoreductase acuF-like C2H2 type zinc-finger domain-containing protein n=1 Tax=Aspergillus mulundensis TaxID=1810919 RepID=A0A3D8RYD9_9EURO|nr:hypothetical protein DSM5745_05921 [Aspergillus mulundensis]RDW79069.1 hypothetical protein DSM5745_05921 [Aspergillus mulundensis]
MPPTLGKIESTLADAGIPFGLPIDTWIASGPQTTNQDFLGPDAGPVEVLYRRLSLYVSELWISVFRNHLHGPALNATRDAVVRLCLWKENFVPGRLDEILQYTSYLRENVLDTLRSICGAIIQIARGIPAIETQAVSSLRDLQFIHGQAIEELMNMDGSGSSSDGSSLSEEASFSESDINLYERLETYINCLMDLAIAVEHQTNNIRELLDESAVPERIELSVSEEARPFARIILDRFKDANLELVERLSQANWDRSVRLIQLAEDAVLSEENQTLSAFSHDTRTRFVPISVFHDSGLGSSSVASHSSFASRVGEDSLGRPRVPPLPAEGEQGRYFQCCFCKKTISMQSRVQWKMHVFSDLQSYICTHSVCKHALKMFPTRSLWAKHEIDEHFSQLQWRCFSCDIAFGRDEFMHHFLQVHNETGRSDEERDKIAQQAAEKVPVANFAGHACPLCLRTDWASPKAYTTRLGEHLEEISLACLPLVNSTEPGSLTDISEHTEGNLSPSTPDESPETAEENLQPSVEHSSPSNPTSKPKNPPLAQRLRSRLRKLSGFAKRPTSPTNTPTENSKHASLAETTSTSVAKTGDPNKLPQSTPLFASSGLEVVVKSREGNCKANMCFSFDSQLLHINLMSVDGWKKLRTNFGYSLEALDDVSSVRGIGGAQTPIMGVVKDVQWHLEDGYRTYSSDFHIVDMHFDVLLGMDTIKKCQLLRLREDLDGYLQKKQRETTDINSRS